ncbi:hypothetical protein O3P69_008702 [Scylla paramamosain]|uniref:FHA domain-containing protein n=1 Tax=Scylla paramamosain TaxID=85552 RepID=A0AAW0SL69_SCYPA
MVGLMMESQSEETTKPSSTTSDATQQDQVTVKQEEEEVFKKPLLPGKAEKVSSKREGTNAAASKLAFKMEQEREDSDVIFKKPVLPARRQDTKVEEEEDVIFKKPISPVKTQRQDIKYEEEEDIFFKKPVSFSKPQKQTSKTEEDEDAVFRKPVFISKAQRLAGKADGQQKEDSDQVSSSITKSSASFKSPAQSLVEKSAAVPYKEPKWSGVPRDGYSFEVLKGGVIVEVVPLNRPFLVIGRQSQCDLVLEHPSLSRFHCIIQYRAVGEEGTPVGFYVYDLGSTHGSFHNKHRMKPQTYYRLRVGHMLKLAGSTRTLVLQGPEEDQDPESELSVSELMALAAERKKKLEKLEEGEDEGEIEGGKKQKRKEGEDSKKTGEEDDTGINWGMREDAEEEEEEEEGEDDEGRKNPFASASEELHLDDPKKTLRGWFERHGYDPPSYTLEEISPGCCRCSVELPVEAPGKAQVVVSVEHRGRRKEAVVQCAMEACRTLDRRNLLRQAKYEGHQHKKRDWAENDYYDSDEDDFLDRTGDIQRRRLKRMKATQAAGKDGDAETYDSLMKKYTQATEELVDLEGKLAEAAAVQEASKAGRGQAPEDDLDSFMHSLKFQAPDKHKRVTWKLRAIELRKEELKLRRLVNIARPLGIPELKPYQSQHGTAAGGSRPSQRPGQAGFGARLKGLAMPTTTTTPKEPEYRVHKIFLEEESKPKLKLKRLDDDDSEEIKPVSKKRSQPQEKEAAAHREPHQRKSSPAPIAKASPSHKAQKSEPQKLCGEASSDELSKEIKEEASLFSKEEKPQHIKSEASSGETLKRPKPQSQDSSTEQKDQPEKKAKVLGPTLPPHLAHKTNPQNPAQPRKKEKRKYDEDDPNYDTWVPPMHQSGDGRTSLNDRLGY